MRPYLTLLMSAKLAVNHAAHEIHLTWVAIIQFKTPTSLGRGLLYMPAIEHGHNPYTETSYMLNAVISLWPHESFDKRDEHRTQLLQHNEEWIETS